MVDERNIDSLTHNESICIKNIKGIFMDYCLIFLSISHLEFRLY